MKQLLLIAIIHLLIFHQYNKDKSEILASKKRYIKPVQAIVHSDKDLNLSKKIRTNETPDTANISLRSAPVKPIQAVYFLPAIPAMIK
ncbi:MAG: hypothetical protein ACXWV1_05870 [Chitinophagaceae bacterium]